MYFAFNGGGGVSLINGGHRYSKSISMRFENYSLEVLTRVLTSSQSRILPSLKMSAAPVSEPGCTQNP